MMASKNKKRKATASKNAEEATMKKALRMTTEDDLKADREFEKIGDLLPTFRKKDGAISDEDLKKLFDALIGPTDKKYDSDDSMVSAIDFMSDEEIAARDKKLRAMIASLPLMEEECRRAVCLFNMETETVAEREARRRRIREKNMTTREEKEEAERMRRQEQRMLDQRLAVHVQVFEKKPTAEPLPYVSCSQIAALFEILSEIMKELDETDKDHSTKIMNTDSNAFVKKIKYHGTRINFFLDGKESAKAMVCSIIRRLIKHPSIIDVLMTDRYGFKGMTTSQIVDVFSKYFRRNSPKPDDGSSLNALLIHIRRLIEVAFVIARKGNANFVINETLRGILYD